MTDSLHQLRLLNQSSTTPKPRIYWTYYRSLDRGFWSVRPMPYRSTKTIEAWTIAHNMVREMNLDVVRKANPIPRPEAAAIPLVDAFK